MGIVDNIKNIVGAGVLMTCNIVLNSVTTKEEAPFIHAYLNDIALPASLYLVYRAEGLFRKNRKACAAFTFVGCSVFEIAQKIGWYSGYFDSNDFAAYAVGVGLGVGVDYVLNSKDTDLLEQKISDS